METNEIMVPRDIEAVTDEILEAKRVGGEATLTIGKGLIEAKELLGHGEWLPWLNERVEFSERSARNFMRLARDWTNRQALADLGATKALMLLSLSENERDDFIFQTHEVDGEEKTVTEMSTRELEQAIRERDEARKAAQDAAGEISRLKDDALNLNMAVDRERAEKKKAQAEIQALKTKPVEVAVEVDESAVKAAKAEADEARAAQRAAEEARDVLSRQMKTANARLAELEAGAKARPNPFAGDDSLIQFKLLFEQAQEIVNKLHGLRLKVAASDAESAGKLGQALDALAGRVKEAAA